MKFSPRNLIQGNVAAVDQGVTSTTVELDCGGTTITAADTDSVTDGLGLTVDWQSTTVVMVSGAMSGVG